MEHKASTYEGSVHMTIQQMIEVRRAISARIGNWIADGQLGEREEEINWLMEAGKTLDQHIDIAVDEWEADVARKEVGELDNEEAFRKFLEGDK